jgi:phenylacetate-CoA ligase
MLKLYHRLPPPARSLAATLRGYYLRHWRYGRETDQLVQEALERELWTDAQWKDWQDQRLAFVLHRAATRVPYYRQYWQSRRAQGNRRSWEHLENWPILEKEPLRQNSLAFVADDCNVRQMFREHTSGTTGKSLNLWVSKDTVRRWYALFEARSHSWYGVSRHDRWAMLGGQLVTPVAQTRPPFWVWNAALNQLYMSSYHLAPNLIRAYVDALVKYKIRYIIGYTSSLYELAQEIARLNQRDLRIKVVITNAEPVFDYQRKVIETAFDCPVRETYGMSEIAAAAGECEKRKLHWWPEVSRVEILGDGGASSASGELITTGLMNADMPLVRYRVGDRCRVPVTEQSCSCGRTLPLLDSIEGRTDDVLYTRQGRRVGRLDPVFKSAVSVSEAQIIQETLDRVRVRFVPTRQFTSEAGRSLTEALRARMGHIEVVLEPVDRVPRGANGKFRAVICNLPPEERALLSQSHSSTASSIYA